MNKRILAVVPTFHQHRLVAQMLASITREDHGVVDVLLVDNGNSLAESDREIFRGIMPNVNVLQPPTNLGWLCGTNLGWHYGIANDYRLIMTLNDDVVLSPGFFSGLRAAVQETGAGIVAPLYDDAHSVMRSQYSGPALLYQPEAEHKYKPYVDGTAMLVHRDVIETIGYLDEERFGKTGWGADFDYCIRAKLSGFRIAVTALSYLNHLSQRTAKKVFGSSQKYGEKGAAEMNNGLCAKWTSEWRGKYHNPLILVEHTALRRCK